MSKTFKTAPLWVRANRRTDLLEEWHDHRDGYCTLPPGAPAPQTVLLHQPRTGCGWIVARQFWFDGSNCCGCRSCADQRGRKAAARRDRYAGRRFTRSIEARD